MNFILKALIALSLAVPALSSVYLQLPTEHDLTEFHEGELSIEVSPTIGADMSVVCNMILLQAFDASYKQVYGYDGMMVAIEAETVVPNTGVVRRRLGTYTTSYVVSWVSAQMPRFDNGNSSL